MYKFLVLSAQQQLRFGQHSGGAGSLAKEPYPPRPTFSEIVLCQGCSPENPLLCHSPRHSKLVWPCHLENLVGDPVVVLFQALASVQLQMSYAKSVIRGLATGGEGRGPILPLPYFNPNQTRSNRFGLKHQGYCFLWVFRNETEQNFPDFLHVYYNLWTFTAAFHFF